MTRQEPRNEVLFVRVKKANIEWVEHQMKAFGYKSRAQFLDAKFDELRNARKPKRVARGN